MAWCIGILLIINVILVCSKFNELECECELKVYAKENCTGIAIKDFNSTDFGLQCLKILGAFELE